MTKSLTEKWKNGELDCGHYYLKLKNRFTQIDHTHYVSGAKSYGWKFTDRNDVKEVLTPVPNYEKFQRLQEQLKEANEVIESLRTYDFTVDDENAEYYQVKWNVEAKRFYKNRKWGVK